MTDPDRQRSAEVVVVAWPVAATSAADFVRELIATVRDGTVVYVRSDEPVAGAAVVPAGSGFAAAINKVPLAHPGADVVVVCEPCRFPAGWLERLRAAAQADDTVAGAIPLTSGEPPLFDAFATDPQSQPSDEPLHPRIFRLRTHCSYIRARTLELIGRFDEALAHPAAVLDDYSARCLARGLSVALADNVQLERAGAGAPDPGEDERGELARRYPWFGAARAEEDALELGPLRRSLVTPRAAATELSVTIDARLLGSAGTQTYTSALTVALARSGRFRVRAVVRDDAAGEDFPALRAAGVAVVSESEAKHDGARTDIAHRPQQAFVPEDLSLLRELGERVVVSHLDLILYRSPGYHANADEWRRYRRVTRVALGAADRVVFLSEHARRDAVAEELIEQEWTSVVGSGTEPAGATPARRPERVPDRHEFVLMLGADYLHKNRVFALALVDQLRRRHGWEGLMVLAGGHVEHGGSAAAEAELLEANAELAAHTLDLGSVAADERSWLLANARAVLYPSLYEGFGLVPLEAGAAGVPCVFAPIASLPEVAGTEAATIVPWDAAASADRTLALLREGDERRRHLELLDGAIARFQWPAIVGQLEAIYRETLASPYRSSVPRAWEELTREQLVLDLDQARRERDAQYDDLRRRVEYGLPLIDDDGLLTREQQHGLIRIASRRWLGGPLLAPVGWLGALRAKRRDQG